MTKSRTEAGKRIRHLRESAGLTTRELDDLAGLTRGHSSQIENLLGDRVSARTMLSIGRVFGVDSAWLLDGEGREPTQKQLIAAVRLAQRRFDAASEPPDDAA